MSAKTCTAGFDWCEGGSPDCHDDHSSMTYQQATLGYGAPYRGDDQLFAGVGVRFNAHDGDIAPRIVIHVQGGPKDLDVQVDLRPAEAHALSVLLDSALMDATTATLTLLPPRLAADLLEVDGTAVTR